MLLKPLAQAERDGDTILAVIRGSAENHGGMSTSLTAPNPRAQADLIVEAHRKAGIDPRSVGYIECHGTGTSLGDPIEVNGLKMAFEAMHRDAGIPLPDHPYCGLGSVKSNIGHAAGASGISQLIKVVLQIVHRQLVPSIKAEPLNASLCLPESPFVVQRQCAEWRRPVIEGIDPSRELPLRALINSFGSGGSYVSLIVEEPPPARSEGLSALSLAGGSS